jgi:hypothetical protein
MNDNNKYNDSADCDGDGESDKLDEDINDHSYNHDDHNEEQQQNRQPRLQGRKSAMLQQIVDYEEQRLVEYLVDDSFIPSSEILTRREYCCNSSRSLYCPECCKILIPEQYWPQQLQQQQQQQCQRLQGFCFLPFSIELILGNKERRTSSTGIQLMVLCQMMKELSQATKGGLGEDDTRTNSNTKYWWDETKLYDLSRGDTVPNHYNLETTFLLFPQKGKSVPISAVANKIERLVVPDIKWSLKWSRPGFIQLDDTLSKLPSVHLECPPTQSHFWRWHNFGPGMLSTIEAIYFAAVEVNVARHRHCPEGDSLPKHTRSTQQQRQQQQHKQQESLLHIMWLFKLQRSIVEQRSLQEGRPVAFSKEAKDLRAAARSRKDGKDSVAREKRAAKDLFYTVPLPAETSNSSDSHNGIGC